MEIYVDHLFFAFYLLSSYWHEEGFILEQSTEWVRLVASVYTLY